MIYTTDIIGDQLTVFASSVMLGILISWCFDFFCAVKILFSLKRKIAIAADIVFYIWAGFLTFSFLLNENYGIPRFYIYFGEAIGFSIWHFTAGKVIIFVLKKSKIVLDKIFGIIFSPIKWIYMKISPKIKKISLKIKNILVKKVSYDKKLLKKKSGVVYNKLCLNVKEAFSFCGRKAGKENGRFENVEEKEPFDTDSSYCLRNVSYLFPDIDSDENK